MSTAVPANSEKKTAAKSSGVSIAANKEARGKLSASGRWATILKTDGKFDKDPREQVIVIAAFEPGHLPEALDLEAVNEDGKLTNKHIDNYTFEEVPEGVLPGMRRGGGHESVAGFGWKDAANKTAHGDPIGPGATRLADVGKS